MWQHTKPACFRNDHCGSTTLQLAENTNRSKTWLPVHKDLEKPSRTYVSLNIHAHVSMFNSGSTIFTTYRLWVVRTISDRAPGSLRSGQPAVKSSSISADTVMAYWPTAARQQSNAIDLNILTYLHKMSWIQVTNCQSAMMDGKWQCFFVLAHKLVRSNSFFLGFYMYV